MDSSVKLGRIFGIEIGIHFSWFVILILVVWSLATIALPQIAPHWAPEAYWLTSLTASFLLFASILAHEMGHSLVAKRLGIPVKSVVLFILGGVSNLGRDVSSPRDEFLMAAAGPATSFGLAVVFWGGWLLFGDLSQPLAVVLLYVAFMNGIMAVFNLIPGFPLDGGRIFRSTLWWLLGDVRRATQVASWAGQGLATFLIVIGLAPIAGFSVPLLGLKRGLWNVDDFHGPLFNGGIAGWLPTGGLP